MSPVEKPKSRNRTLNILFFLLEFIQFIIRHQTKTFKDKARSCNVLITLETKLGILFIISMIPSSISEGQICKFDFETLRKWKLRNFL